MRGSFIYTLIHKSHTPSNPFPDRSASLPTASPPGSPGASSCPTTSPISSTTPRPSPPWSRRATHPSTLCVLRVWLCDCMCVCRRPIPGSLDLLIHLSHSLSHPPNQHRRHRRHKHTHRCHPASTSSTTPKGPATPRPPFFPSGSATCPTRACAGRSFPGCSSGKRSKEVSGGGWWRRWRVCGRRGRRRRGSGRATSGERR